MVRNGSAWSSPHTEMPTSSPSRSSPSCKIWAIGVGIGDLNHLTTFALAFDPARLAPASGPLPLKTGLFEDLSDGVGAHRRQPVRSLTQGPPQRRKRPASGCVLLTVGFPAYLRQDALALRCCVDGPASTSVARL